MWLPKLELGQDEREAALLLWKVPMDHMNGLDELKS